MPEALKGYLALAFFALLIAASVSSCLGTMAAVQGVVGTEETIVYEECEEYQLRIVCTPVEEPYVIETTSSGVDFWAGLAVAVVTLWLGGAGFYYVAVKRLRWDVDPNQCPVCGGRMMDGTCTTRSCSRSARNIPQDGMDR